MTQKNLTETETKTDKPAIDMSHAGLVPAGMTPATHKGFDWQGPAGFWLLLSLAIAATIVVGLFFG